MLNFSLTLRPVNVGDTVYQFDELMPAIFVNRINRFLAIVKQKGVIRYCHIHDPGRLPELRPGTEILIRETEGKKTNCSLTAFLCDSTWVIADSRIHSSVASSFLPANAKREVKVGESRLDFFYDKTFVEVKGCTLVHNGVALFPDSPTERGRKHLNELIRLSSEGYASRLIILVMREDAFYFLPNEETDPAFSETFWKALERGVKAEILKFGLSQNRVIFKGQIPVFKS
jgi:sugar fermentation stimulation protein A